MIRRSRGQFLLEQCGVKGLAQGPNSCTDLIQLSNTPGLEPPTFRVPVKGLSYLGPQSSTRLSAAPKKPSAHDQTGVYNTPKTCLHFCFKVENICTSQPFCRCGRKVGSAQMKEEKPSAQPLLLNYTHARTHARTHAQTHCVCVCVCVCVYSYINRSVCCGSSSGDLAEALPHSRRATPTCLLSVCRGGGGGRAQSRYSILTRSHCASTTPQSLSCRENHPINNLGQSTPTNQQHRWRCRHGNHS